MRYGRGAPPKGFLPVFSVNTEEEAQELLIAACSHRADGHFYSDELSRSQDLEMLQRFSDKLDRIYNIQRASATHQHCNRLNGPNEAGKQEAHASICGPKDKEK